MSESLPQPPISFDQTVDCLAEILSAESREKVALFIRQSIEAVVRGSKIQPKEKTLLEKVVFRLIRSSRFEVQYELGVLIPQKRPNKLKSLFEMGLKVDFYRGVPDGFQVKPDLSNLPPPVNRSRLMVKDVWFESGATWVSVKRLNGYSKKGENNPFLFDVEESKPKKMLTEQSPQATATEAKKPEAEPTALAEVAETSPCPSDSPAESTASPDGQSPSPSPK